MSEIKEQADRIFDHVSGIVGERGSLRLPLVPPPLTTTPDREEEDLPISVGGSHYVARNRGVTGPATVYEYSVVNLSKSAAATVNFYFKDAGKPEPQTFVSFHHISLAPGMIHRWVAHEPHSMWTVNEGRTLVCYSTEKDVDVSIQYERRDPKPKIGVALNPAAKAGDIIKVALRCDVASFDEKADAFEQEMAARIEIEHEHHGAWARFKAFIGWDEK